MKNILASALVLALSSIAFAGDKTTRVYSKKSSIAASRIGQVITLAQNNDGGINKKVNLVLEDHGLTTDISPRYTVYLTYASLGEMGNMYADFKLNENAYEFKSASLKADGTYEIKVTEYRDADGIVEVTQTVDTKKLYSDAAKKHKLCSDGFCDGDLNTSVVVKESVSK